MFDKLLGWLGLQRTGTPSATSTGSMLNGTPHPAQSSYGDHFARPPSLPSASQPLPPVYPPPSFGPAPFQHPVHPWGSMPPPYYPPPWASPYGFPATPPYGGMQNIGASRPGTEHAPGFPNLLQTPHPEAHVLARVPIPMVQDSGDYATRPLEKGAGEVVERTDEQKGAQSVRFWCHFRRSYALAVADAQDWPQGYQRREHRRDSSSMKKGKRNADWKQTRWAWRSIGHGTHPDNGMSVERRGCLGVIRCAHCSRYLRPKTDPNSRKRQLIVGCENHACPRDSLGLIKCDARAYHFSEDVDGETIDVWEHAGSHDHPRPPRDGYLTTIEEELLDAQIKRRPDATAHQLRTGDAMADSVPLAVISPALADPHRARYHVNKGRSRLDLRQSASKGGGTILHALAQLNKEFGVTFLVNSGFTDRAFVVMQSTFMRQNIKENIDDCLDSTRSPGPADSRHGNISDTDHSYFREGLLMTSCAFNPTMNAWAPAVYSWIDGQGTDDHRVHFRQLNSTIVECAGDRFEPKLLSAVRHALTSCQM